MKDEEVALEILKMCYFQKGDDLARINTEIYHEILEQLRNYKSETTLGKIKELIEEYYQERNFCDYTRIQLIEKIREILN